MLWLLVTKSHGTLRLSYMKRCISSSFSIIIHLPAKEIREGFFNQHTDLASLLPSDELPKMILERQYFIDDYASHSITPLSLN